MTWLAWAILILGNAPVYVIAGWLIFGDWDSFLQCLAAGKESGSWGPVLRGEIDEDDDSWGEFRFGLWLAICAAAVFLEYWFLLRSS